LSVPAATAAPAADSSPRPAEALLGIGQAAVRAGVSERALRYYQELGLITPSGCTPGGLRRYSAADLARVAHLRELQDLLGFNLEEIRVIFDNEDHLAEVRKEYRSEGTGAARRRELLVEAIAVRSLLRDKVTAKLDALTRFLETLDRERARAQQLLDDGPPAA
jgi:DNA-binding transcriptional MerR regulator